MRIIALGPVLVISLGACSNSFEDPLLLDGPQNAAYQTDLAQCRALAAQHTQGQGKTAALQGAGIGAVIGVLDGNDGDRADGALVGAAIGGGLGALEGNSARDEEQRTILLRCMQGRGHRVLA